MYKDELIESDFLNVEYDFIEYYVGMAKMVVYWHVKALGFKVMAYYGPEKGQQEKCSYYLVKNNIKIVITAASQPSSHDIVSFVDLHGNGIKRIGIAIKNIDDFYVDILGKGAIPVKFPAAVTDSDGKVVTASIKIFDDNEIMFVDTSEYNGIFLPGYKPVEEDWDFNEEDSCLTGIDHIASAMRINEMSMWERYFNTIFQSKTVKCFDHRQNGEEEKIGMLLKVLQTEGKQMNNVLVEPDQHKSTQVQLFLDKNYGSGIQHVAFTSSNIFNTVEVLRKNGVRFSSYPDSYYTELKEKYPALDVAKFKKYGILCDIIGDSLLLQVFTTPIGDRPTFFYEIIQRVNNYEGFGIDNIKALFEAVEREKKLNLN